AHLNRNSVTGPMLDCRLSAWPGAYPCAPPLERILRRHGETGRQPGTAPPCDMTDEFDFDFDVNRGRSGSRTRASDSHEPAPFEPEHEEEVPVDPPDLDRPDPRSRDLDSPDLGFGWDEPADPPELDESGPDDEGNGGGGVAGFLKRVQSSAGFGSGGRKG